MCVAARHTGHRSSLVEVLDNGLRTTWKASTSLAQRWLEQGRTTRIAHAHRSDEKWFIMRVNEKLTIFRNSNRQFAVAADCLDKLARFVRNSSDMKTSIPSVLITFALVCLTFVQNTQAVNPPPDGAYPSGNTAEGANALFSLTTGGYNTGNGWNSLHTLSSGSFNTGIGAATLFANTGDQHTATGAAALFSNTTGRFNT